MNMFAAVSTCMRKYADFEGRATRSEYWWFFLFTLLVHWGCLAVIKLLDVPEMQVAGTNLLMHLFFLLPGLTAGVRRLHDVGKSGWFVLLPFTFIGLIPFIYWLVKASDEGRNAYGAPSS